MMESQVSTAAVLSSETASIGEEMDEHYLFEPTVRSRGSSKSHESLASSTASEANPAEEELQEEHMRPKTLSISGFSKFWRRGDKAQLSHSEKTPSKSSRCDKTRPPPKIKCSIVSAPSTPSNEPIASSWTYGWHAAEPKHHSSFSSVDEEQEVEVGSVGSCNTTSSLVGPSSGKRSKSRLSLNLLTAAASHADNTGTRSPRMLPKFLRSSFSKLMGKTPTNDSHQDSSSTELARSGSTCSFNVLHPGNSCYSLNVIDHDVEDEETHCSPTEILTGSAMPGTPSTQAYLEETKLSGLPVIPFAYPTCVLVEKFKNKNKMMATSCSKAVPVVENNNRRTNYQEVVDDHEFFNVADYKKDTNNSYSSGGGRDWEDDDDLNLSDPTKSHWKLDHHQNSFQQQYKQQQQQQSRASTNEYFDMTSSASQHHLANPPARSSAMSIYK